MSAEKNASKHEHLIGRRVCLRAFSETDVPFVKKWSDDAEIRKLIGEVAPMSRAEAEKYYEELRADKGRV